MPDHSASQQRQNIRQQTREQDVEGTLRKQARLIDLAPVAAIVRELDGTIIFWSQGAEALYGWSKEEALGRHTHDLLQTQFPEPLESIISKLLTGKKWTGELQHRTKDGRIVIVESHWLAEMDSKGEVIELLESNMDITERKKLQEHLEELVQERTAELNQKNADLEAFSYSLSHDMRGPLRAILGFTEFAIEDCGDELSPLARDYLGKVSAAARRLERLIQDVLVLSQVSKAAMEMTTIDLDKLVREIISERPELQEPNAQIELEGKLGIVQGHGAFVLQIVSNLLANAVKFVAPGTKPQVRLRSEGVGQNVRFWVEDNGIGIEPQAVPKLFELFGRTHRAKDYEGTGIGLAIIRRAVERLGGRVGVESEVGKGSRFWVELPRANQG